MPERLHKHMGGISMSTRLEEGYLWNKIDYLSDINKCYSEFTHPRQWQLLIK